MSSTSRIESQARNGSAAAITFLRVVPFGATPVIKNRRSPKGGVVRLISMANNTTMPNQTGSKPMAFAKGKKNGMVISKIDS